MTDRITHLINRANYRPAAVLWDASADAFAAVYALVADDDMYVAITDDELFLQRENDDDDGAFVEKGEWLVADTDGRYYALTTEDLHSIFVTLHPEKERLR